MRRALAAAAVTALVLTGCAAEEEPSTSAEESPTASESASASASVEPSPSPSPDDTDEGDDPDDDALEIEIEGDSVKPNGKRVKVTAGEPVVLEIESDRAAELHVHSSPEQVLQVKRGESRIELTIKTPGVVDVEEHDSGIVILQLEVR